MSTRLNLLTFDGTALNRDNIYIFPDDDNLKAPERDVESVEIPGRSGELLFDNHRYKNATLGYKFIALKDRKYYDWFKNFFLGKSGYCRLEDSTDREVYRMARCTGVSPLTVYRDDTYTFSATFSAKPQRWAKIGEFAIDLSKSGMIYSQYMVPAEPLLRVYGYGHISVGTGQVTVSQNSHPYIDIDCSLKDAFYGSENCNSLITVGTWPTLEEGMNDIVLPETVTKLELTPRWWSI